MNRKQNPFLNEKIEVEEKEDLLIVCNAPSADEEPVSGI